MQLAKQFVRSGEWLFRWRSYLPLLFLFPLAWAVVDSCHERKYLWADTIWPVICLGISITGMAVRLHCVGHAAPGTSGRNTKQQIADSLNTTGMYSIVRHPLYLANFLIAFGIVAQPNNWWLIGLYGAAFALYYERIMFTEEAFLLQKFGQHYREWAEVTPAFLPRLSGYRPASQKFNLSRVLQKESAAVAVITVSFTLLELAEHVKTGIRSLDPWWFVLALVGSLAYASSRVFKRVMHAKSQSTKSGPTNLTGRLSNSFVSPPPGNFNPRPAAGLLVGLTGTD